MHLLEPRNAGDGILDRLGHLLGHVRRAGTGVRGDDRDDGKIDVREEFLLEAAPGGDPGNEKGAGEQEHDAPLAEGDAAETAHEAFSRLWLCCAFGLGSGSAVKRSMARSRIAIDSSTQASS